MKKIALFRILGNDLDGLHGDSQTVNNLKFTLENEPCFEDVDKFFVLNRIISADKKSELISLLNEHEAQLIDLPFERERFDELSPLECSLEEFSKLSKGERVKKLYQHNLYLVNNNGARNFCISRGKSQGYDWIFPFDSNNFMTREAFELLRDNLKESSHYLAIPQSRIKDAGLSNEDIFTDTFDWRSLPLHEPQLAFAAKSRALFNEKICYGCGPKAELLTALGVQGKWNRWKDNEIFLGIKTRGFWFPKKQTLSNVIRLDPQSSRNERAANWDLRLEGLFKLVLSQYR